MTSHDLQQPFAEAGPSSSSSAGAASTSGVRTEEALPVSATNPSTVAADDSEFPEPRMAFPDELYLPTNFPAMQNTLLLDAATCQPDLPRSPVWVMRQAGRYLPEFRALRKKHGFFEICRSPPLAAEITLQPTRRYKSLLDAAIIFSDILVIPQAMGMEVGISPRSIRLLRETRSSSYAPLHRSRCCLRKAPISQIPSRR